MALNALECERLSGRLATCHQYERKSRHVPAHVKTPGCHDVFVAKKQQRSGCTQKEERQKWYRRQIHSFAHPVVEPVRERKKTSGYE